MPVEDSFWKKWISSAARDYGRTFGLLFMVIFFMIAMLKFNANANALVEYALARAIAVLVLVLAAAASVLVSFEVYQLIREKILKNR